jgi:outer membrane protein insertion porin family
VRGHEGRAGTRRAFPGAVRVIALGVLITAAACAGRPPPVASPGNLRVASADELAAFEGETLVSVDIAGQRAVAAAPLLARLGSRAGERLDQERVAADLRRLWSTSAFADVAALVGRAPGGVALIFQVVERPVIRAARLSGDAPPVGARRVAGLAGGLYEPARVHRMAQRLELSLQRAGHRRASVAVRVQPAGDGRVDVTFQADAGPRYLVGDIDFAGQRRLPVARLRAELNTRDGAVNAAGAPYRDDLLAEDLARMMFLYYDVGMIDARIGPPTVAVDERTRTLAVVVPVHEGAVYRLGRVSLAGRLARQRRRALAALGVRPGETFSRARLAAGMERVQKLVGASSSLVPETAIDAQRRTIDLTLSIAGEEPP